VMITVVHYRLLDGYRTSWPISRLVRV
jgi:hypothetical protein